MSMQASGKHHMVWPCCFKLYVMQILRPVIRYNNARRVGHVDVGCCVSLLQAVFLMLWLSWIVVTVSADIHVGIFASLFLPTLITQWLCWLNSEDATHVESVWCDNPVFLTAILILKPLSENNKVTLHDNHMRDWQSGWTTHFTFFGPVDIAFEVR